MKKRLLDVSFLLFEAVMHVYLVIYLVYIGANLPVILFTAFELTMFIRLLFGKRQEMKRKSCTWREFCPYNQEEQ